ncbi:MAG: hypothetical protein H6658_19240 [Ardenticatenaceae bacterium]|nr:hypothetical protein [Ardenticatenaceae bacterium]
MSDHCYVIAAGLQAHGLAAEPLPPPDDETLAIGLDLCRGRECLPCFTTTGDIVRLTDQADFDPEQAQVLMVSSCGPCRFGQYLPLQQGILAERGMDSLEFISPTAENNYQGFGERPIQLRKLLWEGFVAVDLLIKLLHAYRPYELEAGETERVYAVCLEEVLTAVRANGSKKLDEAMRQTAVRFEAISVDKREKRPLIGLVGEIYLRLNSYSNQDIIRKVEAAGGEVVMATMIEWLYFNNWGVKTIAKALGMHLPAFLLGLSDRYQKYRERKLAGYVEHVLGEGAVETAVEDLLNSLRPYYEPYLGTEAVMTMGKAIEYAHAGFAGILNVMPFTCMPGLVTAGMAPRFRPDLHNIPWLDVSYDAQRGTNLNTRLEAFMYQAIEFHRSRKGF